MLSVHAVETRTQNARARGPAYWECLASEEDVQPSLNSFNHKSKRTRCPRVGVSLESLCAEPRPMAKTFFARGAKRHLYRVLEKTRACECLSIIIHLKIR